MEDYQCGFRKEGVVDQVFMLREIQSESHQHQLECQCHALLIDFKQSCDGAIRTELYKVLQDLRLSQKLIHMVRMALDCTENRVRANGKTSKNSK